MLHLAGTSTWDSDGGLVIWRSWRSWRNAAVFFVLMRKNHRENTWDQTYLGTVIWFGLFRDNQNDDVWWFRDNQSLPIFRDNQRHLDDFWCAFLFLVIILVIDIGNFVGRPRNVWLLIKHMAYNQPTWRQVMVPIPGMVPGMLQPHWEYTRLGPLDLFGWKMFKVPITIISGNSMFNMQYMIRYMTTNHILCDN